MHVEYILYRHLQNIVAKRIEEYDRDDGDQKKDHSEGQDHQSADFFSDHVGLFGLF